MQALPELTKKVSEGYDLSPKLRIKTVIMCLLHCIWIEDRTVLE